jgi:hypothetical protein
MVVNAKVAMAILNDCFMIFDFKFKASYKFIKSKSSEGEDYS